MIRTKADVARTANICFTLACTNYILFAYFAYMKQLIGLVNLVAGAWCHLIFYIANKTLQEMEDNNE
jgi:hypothetical protein